MGFLDDLKRQADAAKARETTDFGALERNAALAEAACNSVFKYLASLAQQLNVLLPTSKASYRLEKRHVFEGMKMVDFRADTRKKRNRGPSLAQCASTGRHTASSLVLLSMTRTSKSG